MVGRSSEEELRRQPPVGDVDGLLGLLQSDRDGPEVVASIDVPLDEVPLTLREEGLIAVRLADLGSLVVTALLVLLVVAMVRVELRVSS